jgi:transcriptional regulator with XRE-family HTH domain
MGRKANELSDAAAYAESSGRLLAALAVRVRELRENMGIGVRELGTRVGVSGAMISNYETAKGVPSLRTLLRLAWELGVSPDFLLGPVSSTASLHGASGGAPDPLKLLGDRLSHSQLRFLAEVPPDRLRSLVDAVRAIAPSPGLGGASLVADAPPPRKRRRR